MTISKLDINILDLLQRDASISVQAIADKCAISKSAAWRRIQQLQSQGIIKQQVALLDAEKIGLALTVYISIRTNQHNSEWHQCFIETMDQIDEVVEVCRMSGELDYLIKAVVTDMKHYDRVYQQMIKADLSDVSASFVMEPIKQTTALPLSPDLLSN